LDGACAQASCEGVSSAAWHPFAAYGAQVKIILDTLKSTAKVLLGRLTLPESRQWHVRITTSPDGFGTFELLSQPPKAVTKKLDSSLTLCAMSWTCSSTMAAITMMGVIADMMRGARTPKGRPRCSWILFHVEQTLWLQLVEVPEGSLASEGALELPF